MTDTDSDAKGTPRTSMPMAGMGIADDPPAPRPKAKQEDTPLLDVADAMIGKGTDIVSRVLRAGVKGAKRETRKVRKEAKTVAHAVLDEAHAIVDTL